MSHNNNTSNNPPNVWAQHASKLSGGWKCISFEIHSPSAGKDNDNDNSKPTIHKPHGDSPLGRAIITRHGYISTHMSVPSLMAAFQETGSQWRQGASDGDVAKVARGLGMYCGYLELYEGSPAGDTDANSDAAAKDTGARDGVDLWWAAKCDVSVDPNRIGRLEKRKCRYYRGDDGTEYMVLQPFGDELTPNADHVRAVLKWVKFEQA